MGSGRRGSGGSLLGDLFGDLFGAIAPWIVIGLFGWFLFVRPVMNASGGPTGDGNIPTTPPPSTSAVAPEYELAGQWSCGYAPTMNYDWHDDVLCTNGMDSDRPYLLRHKSFVTQDDLMKAADEYETRLNSG